MAIKEIRREWSACQLGYVCEFMLHTEADVKDLPICCVGSVAHVSETNRDFVCTGKRWVLRAEEVVILRENNLTRTEDGVFIVTEPLANPLVVGMECAVKYNGAEYTCPVKAMDMEGMELPMLGNSAVIDGEDTGEPFVFAPYPAEMAQNGLYAQLTPLDGAESVTLSITAKNELANESGNTAGGGVFFVEANGTDAGDGSVVFDKTYAEILAAHDAGMLVMCHMPWDDNGQTITLYLTAKMNTDDGCSLSFSAVIGNIGSFGLYNICLNPDGTGKIYMKSLS